MPKIAMNGDNLNTGVFTPATVNSTQTFVKINGVNMVIEGDSVATHSRTSPDETHSNPSMTNTQSFVTITVGGTPRPIIVDGDSASCSATHTVNATGFVTIGD